MIRYMHKMHFFLCDRVENLGLEINVMSDTEETKGTNH